MAQTSAKENYFNLKTCHDTLSYLMTKNIVQYKTNFKKSNLFRMNLNWWKRSSPLFATFLLFCSSSQFFIGLSSWSKNRSETTVSLVTIELIHFVKTIPMWISHMRKLSLGLTLLQLSIVLLFEYLQVCKNGYF